MPLQTQMSMLSLSAWTVYAEWVGFVLVFHVILSWLSNFCPTRLHLICSLVLQFMQLSQQSTFS